ncbi:hypothetical protein IVB30_36515 [Bradyrhizobium sp. 200]|uniref:hypothetical protein n=1 Tax=Bradyrhizobium sp. 200 TaxID=2782665 RepID=UPI0020000458|nr:hypothetical protein [Bradyrhizobium sp. 200]UPJ48499.1 hypothetical protein IVB30_36515 [Bradyrhizobium sp. 200]
MSVEDFIARKRRDQETMREFIEAFRAANIERFFDAMVALDESCPWRWADALRAVTRSPIPSDQFRCSLLHIWRRDGDHIRQEVGNDLLLADALRVMLPAYAGPAITLYRGEGFRNRKRRTYGLSWSRNAEIARAFAEVGLWRTTIGGSVLLEATAPPEAIICEVLEADDTYLEKELIVDRRRLRGVKVVARFNQLSHDEFRQRQESATE